MPNVACNPITDGWGHATNANGVYSRTTTGTIKVRKSGAASSPKRAFFFVDITGLLGKTVKVGGTHALAWGTGSVVAGVDPWPYEFCYMSEGPAGTDESIYNDIDGSTLNYATRSTIVAGTDYSEAMAGGFEADLQAAIDAEQSYFAIGIKLDDAAVGTKEVNFRVAAPVLTVEVEAQDGYELYINARRPWQEGDVPITLLANDVLHYEATAAELGLLPSTVYYASIVTKTQYGRSEPISARFVTNGAAEPEVRPSPVTRLTVEAIAGGKAIVRWEYHEPSGIGRADEFGIEVLSLDGSAPIVVADLEATGDSEYQVTIAGPDGRYRVKVYSKRAGLYEPFVTGVDVLLDGTPPVGTVPALTAF